MWWFRLSEVVSHPMFFGWLTPSEKKVKDATRPLTFLI